MYSLRSTAKFLVGLIVLSLPLMGCDFAHQYMYRPSVVERAQMRAKNSLELDKYEVILKTGETAQIVVLHKENVEIKNVISGNLQIATVQPPKGNVIEITGVSPGQTSITVTSDKGEMKKVEVKVGG